MGALKIKKRIKPIHLRINFVFFEFEFEKSKPENKKPFGWLFYPIVHALFRSKPIKQIEPGRYEEIEPNQNNYLDYR